ncbi:DUF393 domain-containing protein [Priestia megaterium]|uniref:DUF393 domain-containing protein n=1 Tax=Priestia megaterium TaxID=1404 RepID=UPI0022B90A28|nr:DUF393 domain-containing protein [Priestia megaterium]MCZ8497364.1 DUF393 domain-containing protein [Priestia megaterium]
MEMLKVKVFYDNWCPICIKTSKIIRSLDILNLIDLVGFREIEDMDIEITKVELEEKMYAVNLRNRKIVSGIHALILLTSRIPLLIPLSIIFKMLSLVGLGQVLYSLLAKNRFLISIGNCTTNSCTINKNK